MTDRQWNTLLNRHNDEESLSSLCRELNLPRKTATTYKKRLLEQNALATQNNNQLPPISPTNNQMVISPNRQAPLIPIGIISPPASQVFKKPTMGSSWY